MRQALFLAYCEMPALSGRHFLAMKRSMNNLACSRLPLYYLSNKDLQQQDNKKTPAKNAAGALKFHEVLYAAQLFAGVCTVRRKEVFVRIGSGLFA